MRALFLTILIFGSIAISHQKTKEEWKSRTIYQVLTDRYSWNLNEIDLLRETVQKVLVILEIIVAETIKDSSKILIILLVY